MKMNIFKKSFLNTKTKSNAMTRLVSMNFSMNNNKVNSNTIIGRSYYNFDKNSYLSKMSSAKSMMGLNFSKKFSTNSMINIYYNKSLSL